jgi:DNA-binding transcriptional LysR family regulator
MFATSDEIDELLGESVAGASRSLRLGADSPIYAVRLAQALMQSHPEIVVEVRIDNARDTLRRLQDASVDLAIVSDPHMDGQFFYEPLFADFLNVPVAASHSLAHGSVFPLAALSREWLLVREPASKTRAATEMLLSSVGVTPFRVLELHGREAIREAIALGMGISLFFSTECPPDKRLFFMRPDHQAERAQLTGYVVCRAERRRTATMRAAFKAAESLKPLSPRSLHGIQQSAAKP